MNDHWNINLMMLQQEQIWAIIIIYDMKVKSNVIIAISLIYFNITKLF